MIDEFMLSEVASRTRWIKVVPIKVNVLAWKIKLDYLPTRLIISRRGMDIDSILCPMCGKAVESTRHIFFICHIARSILRMTTSWWDIMYMEISSYEEWLDWISSLRLPINHKRIFEGVCYVMWWHIWNFRNKTIFGSESPSKGCLSHLCVLEIYLEEKGTETDRNKKRLRVLEILIEGKGKEMDRNGEKCEARFSPKLSSQFWAD
ncbi:RNA-directed DNA polymerase, eukaryota [Tanacetum coccineum]